MRELEKKIDVLRQDHEWWQREGVRRAAESINSCAMTEVLVVASFLISVAMWFWLGWIAAIGALVIGVWVSVKIGNRVFEEEISQTMQKIRDETAIIHTYINFLQRHQGSVADAASLLKKYDTLFLSYDLLSLSSYPRKRESKIDWAELTDLADRGLLASDKVKERVKERRDLHAWKEEARCES